MRSRPSMIDLGDDVALNVAGVIHWLAHMDAADIAEMRRKGKAELAAGVLRLQERARAAMASDAAIRSTPRDEADVLWQTFRGEDLQRQVDAGEMGAEGLIYALLKTDTAVVS